MDAKMLEPYPVGEREAIQSAANFIERHFQSIRCDSDGVSDCVRCNAQYLSKVLHQILAKAA